MKCAGRDLLVITSTRGLQIFDADGSAMLHWHSLKTEQSGDEVFSEGTFMRGIAAVGVHVLCVGEILFSSINSYSYDTRDPLAVLIAIKNYWYAFVRVKIFL